VASVQDILNGSFAESLARVAGFFIVETRVVHCTAIGVAALQTRRLWEHTMSRLVALTTQKVNACSLEQLTPVKDSLEQFAHLLEKHA
jgi:hypothetical protein